MSILLDGTGGVTTPGVVNTAGETIATTLSVTGATNLGALTTTGNTILGDASTDTLNVGNGGLVKDASGNVGIGTASPNFPITIYNVSSQVQFTNSATGTTSSDGFKIGLGGGSSTDAYINLLENTDLIFNTNATEQARITAAGLLKFNSGYGSVATAYGCRAWVSFNGTGTVAIRASGNVSSITDNGTGDYTVNFTTAMPDANYMATQSVGNNNYGVAGVAASAGSTSALLLQTTTQYRIYSTQVASGTSNIDAAVAFVAIFR